MVSACALILGSCWLQTQPLAQNPSPMVEHTRSHPRLVESRPAGSREKLALGNLFIPEKLQGQKRLPLFVHFHGGGWLPEVAAAEYGRAAVLSLQLGSGSSAYARPFSTNQAFLELLREAEARAGVAFEPVALTAWSAGYGAIREILKDPAAWERVQFVLLIDGLHTGYVGGKPGPLESKLEEEPLEVFVRWAAAAAEGKKQMVLTHSEIFPGTFASTTETADYLLRARKLRRQAVLRWGPMGTQLLSETKEGNFLVLGLAGNSAPDHVDQLHALGEWLKLWRH